MAGKKIKSALISVFYKDGLDEIVKELHRLGVTIYSTGGTQEFIEKLSIPVIPVEELTSYPSILGGRVKTLHPKILGGIGVVIISTSKGVIDDVEAKKLNVGGEIL